MSTFAGAPPPFDDGTAGYDPRLSSQRFESFSNFEAESIADSAGDSSPIFGHRSDNQGDDLLSSHQVPETPSPPSNFSPSGGFSAFSPEQNGKGFDGGFEESEGPILSSPAEMEPEEGFPLREWRRWVNCEISFRFEGFRLQFWDYSVFLHVWAIGIVESKAPLWD